MLKLSIFVSAVLALIAGAAVLHSGPATPGSGAEIPYESLPVDVMVVVHADVASLVGSELVRSLAERWGDTVPPHAKYREFTEATGFRAETDLTSVTVGIGGNPVGATPPFYVLIQGDFDRPKIDTFLLENGGYERQELEGLAALVPIEKDAAGSEAIVAWFGEQTMLVASRPDFGKLVRTLEGRAPNAANSGLSELLSRGTGQFRLAFKLPERTDAEDGAFPGPAMLQALVNSIRQSPLGSLDSVLFALDAGSDLSVTLEAAADTPENGAAVFDMIQGYLAMGKMMAEENPELGLVLDRLELNRQEAVVSLSVSMTGDEIRSAIARGGRPRRHPPAASERSGLRCRPRTRREATRRLR